MKHIVLTGGGTAGHVTPNIALIPKLKEAGYKISYIGSYDGMERKLIEDLGIPYYGISSGKLRRYFDPKNFSDPFRVVKGYFEAKKLLKKLKPNVVFSKGGFVSVPVVLAAKACKVPALIHESDMTPGLANKLCIPSAAKVCCNFPETVKCLPENKAVLTGTPIRQELLSGDAREGLKFCGFNAAKPVILVIGGSLGSVAVNHAVRSILPELLKDFQVIHLCGKDKLDASLNGTEGYVQFEYIKDELPDLFAAEGEDGFRAREAEQTARFAREGRQVLSCGGGVVKRPENLRALRQNGVVLFIDRPLDALTVGGGRPLSTSAEALKTMEAQRRPLYLAAADAVIPNETTVADAVAAALEALDAIFVH